MKKIYAIIEVEFSDRLENRADNIAQLVCDRANRHNHTVDNGICIDQIRLKSVAQTPQNLYLKALWKKQLKQNLEQDFRYNSSEKIM